MSLFYVFNFATGGLVLATNDYDIALEETEKSRTFSLYTDPRQVPRMFMVVCRSEEWGAKANNGLSSVYGVYFTKEQAERAADYMNTYESTKDIRVFQYSVDEVAVGRTEK